MRYEIHTRKPWQLNSVEFLAYPTFEAALTALKGLQINYNRRANFDAPGNNLAEGVLTVYKNDEVYRSFFITIKYEDKDKQ